MNTNTTAITKFGGKASEDIQWDVIEDKKRMQQQLQKRQPSSAPVPKDFGRTSTKTSKKKKRAYKVIQGARRNTLWDVTTQETGRVMMLGIVGVLASALALYFLGVGITHFLGSLSSGVLEKTADSIAYFGIRLLLLWVMFIIAGSFMTKAYDHWTNGKWMYVVTFSLFFTILFLFMSAGGSFIWSSILSPTMNGAAPVESMIGKPF